MLHLSVPSQDTQRILSLLKAEKALPEGARVQLDPTDETRRLIPFIGPISNQDLAQFAVIDVETKPSPARTYRDHLPSLLALALNLCLLENCRIMGSHVKSC